MWWIWVLAIVVVLAVSIPFLVLYLSCKITPNQITNITYQPGDTTSPNGYVIVTLEPVNCVVTSLKGQLLTLDIFYGKEAKMHTVVPITDATQYTFPLPAVYVHPGFSYQAISTLEYRGVTAKLSKTIQVAN